MLSSPYQQDHSGRESSRALPTEQWSDSFARQILLEGFTSDPGALGEQKYSNARVPRGTFDILVFFLIVIQRIEASIDEYAAKTSSSIRSLVSSHNRVQVILNRISPWTFVFS